MQCPECRRADAIRLEATAVTSVTHFLSPSGSIRGTTPRDAGHYAGRSSFTCEHPDCGHHWQRDESLRLLRQDPETPPGAALSPVTYAEQHGMRCPVCERRGVQVAGTPQIQGGRLSLVASCPWCQALWIDDYVLVGYGDLEPGEGDDNA